MAAPLPRRTEITARYRVFVKRAIVSALRSVFTDQFPVTEFRNMNVLTSYPLAQIDYPFMVIEFKDQLVSNVGVGHESFGYDDQGRWRKWYQYRFEGTLEFNIFTLSPQDRDFLADALVEMLAFGRLQNLTDQFFQLVYGPTSYDEGGQLWLNTDEIHSMGDSVSEAYWEAEDVKVFQTGYWVECNGSFHSTGETSQLTGFVDSVTVLPYIDGEQLPENEQVTVSFEPLTTWEDNGYIKGSAVISGSES